MLRRPCARLLLLLLQLHLLPDAAQGKSMKTTDFCSRDADPTRTGLQFSKGFNKKVKEEVARSACLYCCINNASHFNITWYKQVDGKLMPLPDTSSSFCRFLDDRQTLQSSLVQMKDGGNYTCVVSNTTHSINATIEFTPTENKVEKINKAIFLSTKKIEYAELGRRKELECKFAITSSFTILAEWLVEMPSGELRRLSGGDEPEQGDRRVRNHKWVIDPVTRDDFRTYVCHVMDSNNSSYRVELKEGPDPDMVYHPAFLAKISAVAVVAVLLVLAVAAGAHWHLEIRLFCKDRFGRVEERDDKEYDIFVCYDKADTQFVMETLVRVLEDNFGYTCYVWQRDTLAGDWISEAIVCSVRRSRRFLMVISPALAENPWCSFALYTAIDAMLNLHSRIICVLLKDVEWPSSQMSAISHPNPTLRQVLRIVRKVVWKKVKDSSSSHKKHLFTSNMLLQRHMLCLSKEPEKDPPPSEDMGKGRIRFWRQLRLYLPPRRSLPLLSKPPESPTSTKSLISLHTET